MQRMTPPASAGFQQVGGVHRAARCRAGADHGMDFVDEEDRAGLGFQFGEHRLEPLLEIAAIARAGQQRPHVEREDRRVEQHLGDFALHDAAGEPLGDRGLADAGIADIERVVLGAPAQDLDRPVDLRLTPDQGIDLAAFGLLVEVDAIGVERIVAALLPLLAALLLLGALHAARLRAAGGLGDAVRDVVDRVEAGHVLLLQEVDRMALALGEHRDHHIGAGDLLASRGLHVDRRALQHALEARGRLGILAVVGYQVGQLVIDVGQDLAAQPVEIDAARAQHRDRILIVGQRQEQVLQGGIFVAPLVRVGQRPMQRLFQIA